MKYVLHSKSGPEDYNTAAMVYIGIKLCFTDAAHNPFELTQKSQKQALDYEKNLCYCYDCDQLTSHALNYLPSDKKNPFIESKKISFPNGTLVSQKYRFYKVKFYIGLIVPKDIGGKTVTYKLCYQKDNCTSGKTSFFGAMSQPEKSKIPIDKENLVVHEILISRKGRNVYDVVQWTNIHLTGVKINIYPNSSYHSVFDQRKKMYI